MSDKQERWYVVSESELLVLADSHWTITPNALTTAEEACRSRPVPNEIDVLEGYKSDDTQCYFTLEIKK